MTLFLCLYAAVAITVLAILADAFDVDSLLKVGVWLLVAALWLPTLLVLAIVWALSAMRRGYVAARGEL